VHRQVRPGSIAFLHAGCLGGSRMRCGTWWLRAVALCEGLRPTRFVWCDQ
jgi:hypothetical protein